MNAFLEVQDCGKYTDEYLSGNIRHYYLSAQTETWDYGPSGLNGYDGLSLTDSTRYVSHQLTIRLQCIIVPSTSKNFKRHASSTWSIWMTESVFYQCQDPENSCVNINLSFFLLSITLLFSDICRFFFFFFFISAFDFCYLTS